MIRVAEEVLAAQRKGRGVVALETTLVAHGFPGDEGVEVALGSERAVRDGGSVPATIGVLDGSIVVGLTEDELARFDASARKLGPRDIAAAVVQRVVGATTAGGTLAVCNAVGIQFMGTGGLGGGLLLARAPDESLDDVEPLIADALARAEAEGVHGQAVTPFVLAYLHRESGGRTLRANRELVIGNARLAGEVAAVQISPMVDEIAT